MDNLPGCVRGEKGGSVVEYALFLVLITAVIVAAVTLLGGNLRALFESIASIFGTP